MNNKLCLCAEKYISDAVNLASEMIKIKSVSGQEEKLAVFVADKMKQLEFDEIHIDKAGNVIGKIKGTGGGKSLMFNCHLDTVDEGADDLWAYPPYSGKIVDGAVWGRGSSDTKGAFAVQLYAAHIIKREGMLPKGDIYVAGVVHEEDSGLGSIVLLKSLKTDYGVIGEASENDIAIFNRGRMRFDLIIQGKSAHASTPENGVNPCFFLAEFLMLIKKIELDEDPVFGRSSIAPTLIQTSETNTNVIPSKLILSIDYRNVPNDSPDKVMGKLKKLVNQCMFKGIEVTIKRVKNPIVCYTGYKDDIYEGAPAFSIDPEHELVREAKKSLEQAFGHPIKIKGWSFGTDSGHFIEEGVPVIGFSPAEIEMCHTTQERISIDMMKKGLLGNLALVQRLCNIPK